MIQSAVKVQRDMYRRTGRKISYTDAINICKQNPFLKPIDGNNDKFKMANEQEIQAIMLEMKQRQEAEANV